MREGWKDEKKLSKGCYGIEHREGEIQRIFLYSSVFNLFPLDCDHFFFEK